ncbi:MAG: beta-lactamase family protein [Pseudomonadales bacterium]|nr:beta-lactamase family protein [Pseudomonadales bacterium]
MNRVLLNIVIILCGYSSLSYSEPDSQSVMEGTPPTRDSQATMKNYRDYPFSGWTFQNMGAPLNIVMVPRGGDIAELNQPSNQALGKKIFIDKTGAEMTLEDLFKVHFARGMILIQDDKVLYEKYFDGFGPHKQHIWFSMSKSLASAALGILVEQGKIDIKKSPAHYIPELKNSGFERVTIQNLLDMATSIDFKETYTDMTSDFALKYAVAMNMGWLPGARDAQPESTEIYGVHDFLSKYIKPNKELEPGTDFDYNSSNADVIGWLISRVSGQPYEQFISEQIWSKLGMEHDAYFTVDRAFMPVVTGGMNSTLRDAARFALMIKNEGKVNNKQLIPSAWINSALNIDEKLKSHMTANPKYGEESWEAYHNMWWILDSEKGEFCATGIHGQVIYINRSKNTVMVWFSNQPGAAAPKNINYQSKLNAARSLVNSL